MKAAIIGATGTLGTALVERLHDSAELVCMSRCELKQAEMARRFPRVKYVLGDIRDPRSLPAVLQGVDVAFLVAALKRVDVLEDNAVEAIKTNVQGTINVAEAAMSAGVKHVVFSSTDKAVLPINVYGMTKGLAERYLLQLNATQQATRFAVFRWGNVAGSRGSVIHAFADSLRNKRCVNITDARMTRFMLHIHDAVDYMLTNYVDARPDAVMFPPLQACSVVALAEAVAEAVDVKDYDVHLTGIRPGEKIHEVMFSSHDYCIRSDTAPQMKHEEIVAMVKRVLQC